MTLAEILRESRHNRNIVPIISKTIKELTRVGHTEVDTVAFINSVIDKSGESFTLEDLINANEQFDIIKQQIDSIDPRKVKFSKSVTTVKNDNSDNVSDDSQQKDKQRIKSLVSSMAARASR